MSRKNYSEEFRTRAVDLYESTPGATIKGIAADLGITRGTLTQWIRKHGTGASTASLKVPTQRRTESQSARIIRLESELAVSQAETKKLTLEREILRQAAKYFAGETIW